jgi:threonine synthase
MYVQSATGLIKEQVMNFVEGLECTSSGQRYARTAARNLSDAGGTLMVRYRLDEIREALSREDIAARPPDLWRYKELLPVESPEDAIRMGEGFTPVIHLESFGKESGLSRLYLKDEAINPTGSFKARGAAVALSRYRELGVTGVALLSSGNAAAAWCLYGRRGGVHVYCALHDDAIRSTVLECMASGAEIETFHGPKSEGRKLMDARMKRGDLFSVATMTEPYRLEGKKTMGYELAEQFDWEPPDVILFPTGGGNGIVSMWKAFNEMRALGWVGERLPRMVSVQLEGCGPLVEAMATNRESADPWTKPLVVIPSGLRTADPFASHLILKALRESGGTAAAVSLPDVYGTMKAVATQEGVLLSPEGAAAVAATRKLRREGFLQSHERVVAFNTASGLKYQHVYEEIL